MRIKKKAVREYDTSHMEIVLNVRKSFEKEKHGHPRINLYNVIRRTAAAAGERKSIVFQIRTVEQKNRVIP